VRLYLVASKPTDAVTYGFLPAADRLGLEVTVLTDQPAAHDKALAAAADTAAADCAPACILGCDVHDFRALIRCIGDLPVPDAVFSNSDHLQVQTAMAACYLGLPGKDWRASLRAKDKLLMRRWLAAAGIEQTRAVEVTAATDPRSLAYPVVVKPADGVASEDVVLVAGPAELAARYDEIMARSPDSRRLIAEQYLPGTLRTLETLGDGLATWVLGGFRTSLSRPPFFTEERLTWDRSDTGREHAAQALAGLAVSFGAAHTEFTSAGLIEVNDRLIGDHCEFLLAAVTGIDVFGQVLRVHLGEPLPSLPPPPRHAHAIADYIVAERPGVLASIPPPATWAAEPGVELACWPLRLAGEKIALTHSNRDYLGVITACGDDAGAVARSVAAARAAWRWEVAA
jgi:biotin carboxylase